MSTLTKDKAVRPRPARKSTPRAKSQAFVSLDALLTVNDWLALPDTKPRYELIEGKLVQQMTTTSNHAWAAGQLLFFLKSWGQKKGWRFFPEGMGYKANRTNGFVPDVVGFSPQQKIESSTVYMETPFLVIEVLSPGTAKLDRTHKKRWYAHGGIEVFILVDPTNQTLEVFRLDEEAKKYGEPEVLGGRDIWQPDEFPGLEIELKELWLN